MKKNKVEIIRVLIEALLVVILIVTIFIARPTREARSFPAFAQPAPAEVEPVDPQALTSTEVAKLMAVEMVILTQPQFLVDLPLVIK